MKYNCVYGVALALKLWFPVWWCHHSYNKSFPLVAVEQ